MSDEQHQQAQSDAASLHSDCPPLDGPALDLLFRRARSHNAWADRDVDAATLRAIYDLMKWAPTSANMSPARLIFVKTTEAKERLRDCLSAGNIDKTMAAPVTAIIASDIRFWEHLPRLFPYADMASNFRDNESAAKTAAFRNATLQGAYFMMAVRALGLDVGPMSGFDAEKVDTAFLADTSFKSNFLCNVGYGDASGLFARSPRFDFEEVCSII